MFEDKVIRNSTIIVLMFFMAIVVVAWIWTQFYVIPEHELPELPLLPTEFEGNVSYNVTAEFGSGWQMFSMPRTMSKEDIYINYQDESYTWQQAINNDYVADYLYTRENGNYVLKDILIKTRGYFVYCFVEGISFSDEPFVLYCRAWKCTDTSTENVVCDKIVSSNLYTNIIECASMTVTGMHEFYYFDNTTYTYEDFP